MTAQPLWTSADARRATGGTVTVEWQCNGISSDSRKIAPGDLYVALTGPHFDGHDFVVEALAKGAAAAMVERHPEGAPADAPLLIVEDIADALNRLAQAARERCKGYLIAITGSVGKTSTKEVLAHVLGDQAPTYANPASFNNHWGVPLSLAGLPADAVFGIFEIGMNHAGEISTLSKLVRPHAALVTTVEGVHLEFFDSVAAIADAKAEIFDGIVEGGVAILNYDNPYRLQLAEAARNRGVGGKQGVIYFGVHPHATLRLVDETLGDSGGVGVIERDGERITFRIGVPGRHWVIIGLSVLATVHAVGANVAQAALALSQVKALPGRGLRHEITVGDGAFTLIDESYNANPASMCAAIAVLATAAPKPGGRRIAVLGDMLELGKEGPELHEALADSLVRAKVDLVFTIGALTAHLRDALPKAMRAGHGAHSEDLAIPVAAAVGDGDVVMVKGSLGSNMATIISALHDINAKPAPRAASNC